VFFVENGGRSEILLKERKIGFVLGVAKRINIEDLAAKVDPFAAFFLG